MYIVKGFATHSNFANNKPNVVNSFGELSTHALTYETDKGIYHSKDDDKITLYTFKTLNNNEYEELSADWLDHISTIVNFIYTKTLSAKEIWRDELLTELIEKFSDIGNSFYCGEIAKDNNYYCPEWVSWKRNDFESSIRIWFSDKSFLKRYDETTLVVVPALENVDDFFKSKKEVSELLSKQTPSVYAERVEKTRNNKPCTVTRVFEATWHDKRNFSDTLPTVWTVLIYGIKGNNIDSIKDAIIEHILNNSSHDRDEWKEVFPDIFKRTEFIFIPRWDKFAIPNRTTMKGIYSPVVHVNEVLEYAKPYLDKYREQWISQYISVFPHIYRSISMLVCGNEENRDSLYRITDVYPDYIAENSTSQDFNRMTEETRDWSEKITNMVIVAEHMDLYSDIPDNTNRLIRNGKLFLSQSIDNIQYLVAAKYNFESNNEENKGNNK